MLFTIHSKSLTGRTVLVENCDSLTKAIDTIRSNWNEGDETEFWIEQEWQEEAVIVIERDADDPEIARTYYLSGAVEAHRCHYVLDSDGQYIRTDVTLVPCGTVSISSCVSLVYGVRPASPGIVDVLVSGIREPFLMRCPEEFISTINNRIVEPKESMFVA